VARYASRPEDRPRNGGKEKVKAATVTGHRPGRQSGRRRGHGRKVFLEGT